MQGKGLGLFFVGLAAVILLAAAGFMAAGYLSGKLGLPGAVLGFILFGLAPGALAGGLGVFLYMRGRQQEAESQRARQLGRLLGLIQARGQVPIDQIMLELRMDRQAVQNAIYELVSLGLFTGYIDWERMVFYTADAAQVGSTTCPNCGGQREFVGRGIVRCPYCGATLFIPPNMGEAAAPEGTQAQPPSAAKSQL